MDNLFLSAFPDAEAAAEIARLAARLRRAHGLRGAPVARSRLHVSLYGFGRFADLPASVVAAAQKIGAKVGGAAFDVAFDRVQSFDGRGRNPFVLLGGEGVSELIAFQELIRRTVAQARLSRPPVRSYTPHVTLLYDAETIDEHPVEPISWRVRELVLVQSLVGRSVYRKLARWPLRD